MSPARSIRPLRRSIRVAIPVQVTFSSASVRIREFTDNLGEGGVFLVCYTQPELGSVGRLTFRIASWESPFDLVGEVVHVRTLRDAAEGPVGFGVRFVEPSDHAIAQLRRLIEGWRDGSVVESIRRAVRESPHGLARELRKRPTDQKVMLAACARGLEIEALVRDGHPAAVERLLSNPAIEIRHVRAVVRDARTPVRVLLAIRRNGAWFDDADVRYLFCRHPQSPFDLVSATLRSLPPQSLERLAHDRVTPVRVREAAKAGAARRAG